MTSDQAVNGFVAIVVGSFVALLLFVPVAAVVYRREGRFGGVDLTLLVSGAIYAIAIWTYTLLPLPDGPIQRCLGMQTDLTAFIGDVRVGQQLANGHLLRNTAFLQLALNVALFVPLGVLVRAILHRGVVVATVLGFAVSLLVETTQHTGVWGIYPCAYRLFDVDDLLTNTAGALLGAVLSWPIALRRHRRAGIRAPLPTTVSLGRRWVGMFADLLLVALGGPTVVIGYRLAELRLGGHLPPSSSALQEALFFGVPLAIQAVLVLALGRTAGELVVDLTTTPRSLPGCLPRRAVKLGTGVGAPLVLLWLGGQVGAVVAAAYVVLTIIATVPGDHRGLSHRASGLVLKVDIEAETA